MFLLIGALHPSIQRNRWPGMEACSVGVKRKGKGDVLIQRNEQSKRILLEAQQDCTIERLIQTAQWALYTGLPSAHWQWYGMTPPLIITCCAVLRLSVDSCSISVLCEGYLLPIAKPLIYTVKRQKQIHNFIDMDLTWMNNAAVTI